MSEDEAGILRIFLKQSQIYITREPAIVTTVLGSCVSVVMFHRPTGIGGICHALLPKCPGRRACGAACPERFRYVDCAIEQMLGTFGRRSEQGSEFKVKLFGGGSIIDMEPGPDHTGVGHQNILTAKRVLAHHGLKPIRTDVGGVVGRKIIFYTHTGDVYVKRFNKKLFLNENRLDEGFEQNVPSSLVWQAPLQKN